MLDSNEGQDGKNAPVRRPVLPLRDIVVFPHMIVPLFVGRDRSIRALEALSEEDDRQILLISQKDAATDDPHLDDIYRIGVMGTVLQLLKLPDGTVKVLVEGGERVRVTKFVETDPFFLAEVEPFENDPFDATEAQALMRTVITHFESYAKYNKKIPPEVLMTFQSIDDPSRLTDIVAANLNLSVSEKQAILEIPAVVDRMEKIYLALEQEIEVLQVEKRIRGRVKRQMEKSHRDYYLNEQMKAIQKELGERDEEKDEINELQDKIETLGLSEEVKKKAESELRKLKQMAPMSAEATVVRNYLDWIVNLPWSKSSSLEHDLKQAEDILEEDHYGLDKVKERILEYLAVQQRVKKMKGPILCLVGPPGVGKTSLAKSIARAAGREYVRISLGGVRDEAEIRGHRRTYIGSMPGKIIQSMKKAGSNNPLFLLDEIDKVGSDYRGDPSSALLEVLDPEQNSTFNDHYMEVDFDLSNVMFITTANSLDISRPLLDRMEIIRLAGYTEIEKNRISRKYLIPKQMEAHGLKDKEFFLSDSALTDIIRYYTREAGVRNLEREIANLCRKAAKSLVMDKKRSKFTVSVNGLAKYLGVKRYRYGVVEEQDWIGMTTGLAWTEVGGELLNIEAVQLEGKGKLTFTGKLGEVMQESVQAAMTYARSRAKDWNVAADFYQDHDFHIHVPEGATPKDGPSAGIAICTSVVSLLTNVPVRRDIAMTGEISLRGHVLIIGGLKEKLLAAHRGRISHVIIPHENLKDLKDVPQDVLKEIEIHPVKHVDEVLKLALTEDICQRGKAPPPKKEKNELVDAPLTTH
ncbi:endopeptidase La [Magnetococcales bacterium HHB-1]